jgi:nitrate reductase gamma subunit
MRRFDACNVRGFIPVEGVTQLANKISQFIQTHLTNKVVLFHRWPWATIGSIHGWGIALDP